MKNNNLDKENIIISIQQPSIPTYRKPIFEKLNDKIKITIFYGFDGVPSDLNLNVEKFYHPLRIINLGVFKLKWHSAQLKAVSRKYDIAILSWDVQFISLWLALIKAKFINLPIILWGHGYSKKDNKLKKLFRNIPIYFASAVILYDYNTAKRLRNIKKISTKVFVAPNSLDQSIIESAKEFWINNKTEFIKFQRENSVDTSFNIIYIGRIYEENKLEILLKAIRLAYLEIKNIKLIVIGNCENDYVKKLKLLGNELEIANNIIWAGAIYDELKIAPWMMSAKVFCYPSNIGLSLMHAFGYGLPAITNSSFSTHNPEIWALKDGNNGLTFTKDDYQGLSTKIVDLYKNENLRNELSLNALKTVREDYNINKMIDGFMKAINFVVKK